MTGWQIKDKGEVEKVEKTEQFDKADSIKIKILRSLVTEEDVALFSGEYKDMEFPIIPGRMAIGRVSELGGLETDGKFNLQSRLAFSPMRPCGECANCLGGKPQICYNPSIAGLTRDGFLKDFAVVMANECYKLPDSVSDNDAVYLEYISLAISVIDRLGAEKGEPIVIFGSDVLSSIIAQLAIYYQSVPILVGENDNELVAAKRSGVYYTVKMSAKVEKEVSAVTGGKMISKLVYVNRSGLSIETAFKLVTPSAKIVFAGYSYPNLKIQLPIAIQKNIDFCCVSNGYGNYAPAINLLANKAIDFSQYNKSIIKIDAVEATLTEMINDFKTKKKVKNMLVNMLG